MEYPEQRYTITINNDPAKSELLDMNIDYFDQIELIKALQFGVKALQLEDRIFITVNPKLFGYDPSERETTK